MLQSFNVKMKSSVQETRDSDISDIQHTAVVITRYKTT